jgi:hypothetical protein
MTHLEVVQAVRKQYPTPLYPDHSAAFLMALCVALQREFPYDPSAGLRRKDAGMHTTLPDGANVALDIVMYPTGAAYDALGDSETLAIPVWYYIGNLPPDWYVPVGNTPTPDPPTPPNDDLARRVTALEAQVKALDTAAVKLDQPIGLETHWHTFVCADAEREMVADREQLGSWEQFIPRKP